MGIFDVFGADKITRKEFVNMEGQASDLIVYFIPVMAVFTFLEMYISWKMKHHHYHTKEAVGSLFVGLGNVALNLLFKASLIVGAIYVYNAVPWRMELNWWTIIPCLFIYDFCSYWAHRISHFNRLFWATHVVHHTAEHYNLTVSFRLSWIQNLKVIFFLPLAFAGFHPVIIFIVNQIGVLFQFWQHTEYIKKLHPWIENLIVTPANHRVHHGSNEKYRDKNFGVMLILWDRLFNTYQKEEERPTYGITENIKASVNPVYLNFHEVRDIIKDVRSTSKFREKMFYVFASPSAIATYKKQHQSPIELVQHNHLYEKEIEQQ